MSIFEDRERAFKQMVVHDEEARFKALAGRNTLLGQWAATQLRLTGREADASVGEVGRSLVAHGVDESLVEKLRPRRSRLRLAWVQEVFLMQAARKISTRGGRATLTILAALSISSAAASAPAAADPLRFETADGHVKFGVEAGVQAVGEIASFWNLARRFAPTARFQPDLAWGEGYLKSYLDFEHRLVPRLALYGGLSVIASGTAGGDILGVGNVGRVLIENAFAGVRIGNRGNGFFADLSAGAQPYTIGSGMLIADGGADGFERGALIFGPRRAWAMTAIGRFGHGPFSVEGFYLDANELRSSDTKTRIAGAKAEWAVGQNQFLGVAWGQVLESTAPYAQAVAGLPPNIIAGGRDGLRFVNAYARINPLPAALPGLWVSADLAIQRSDRIDLAAWGARGEIGYVFEGFSWRPALSYGFQTFSGDKPGTARLERFDPLFYDGGQTAWATGTNGSFVFINSNVNAHKFTAVFTITPQDLLTVRYAHVRANVLNSPIQFGQGTRLVLAGASPGLVSGVPKAHLSDDFLIEYTRVLTPNAFLTLGAGYSIPGSGLRAAAQPQKLDNWTGGFANLVVRY